MEAEAGATERTRQRSQHAYLHAPGSVAPAPMYDTIIIGAGMSGLAAGIRLAYFDQRVCILERHTTIGGLNSFYRLRGRNYDVGLHAITNFTPKGTQTGPLARLLRQLRFALGRFCAVAATRLEIAFPGVPLRFNNELDDAPRRSRPRISRRRTTSAGSREIVDYDDLSEPTPDRSAREVVGRSSAIRCWSRCSSAR